VVDLELPNTKHCMIWILMVEDPTQELPENILSTMFKYKQ
jgi:hypothetical protein